MSERIERPASPGFLHCTTRQKHSLSRPILLSFSVVYHIYLSLSRILALNMNFYFLIAARFFFFYNNSDIFIFCNGKEVLMKTVLAALDSQYIHTNLAIRCLASCCDQEPPILRDYNINQQPFLILKDLLSLKPDAVGFSCYIWNIQSIFRLCSDLKKALPSVFIFLGGPEVSFTAKEILHKHPEIDCILCGEGESLFHHLMECLEQNQDPRLPGIVYRRQGQILGDDHYQLAAGWEHLPSPYPETAPCFAEGKIAYYESSRGCPFSCSYCLSGAMGGGVRERPMQQVKKDLSRFVQEGAPIVKLIDRTFNAHPARAKEIVRYIVSLGGPTRFHFEIGADLLDEELLALFCSSPKGKFQLEAGVQSCNPQTLSAVVRHTRFDKLRHNIKTLMASGNVHLHLDLIAGLPWEDYRSFARSFDQVYELQPHQLQLGFLKLLKGSSLWKNAESYGLVCRDYPPYEVLSTPWISAEELLRLKGIEEVVERYYNSDRARRALAYLMEQAYPSPFSCYEDLADYCNPRGFLNRPMSAANQITALGEFARQKLESSAYFFFLALLKLDYLLSGAKGACPSLFDSIRTEEPIQDYVRRAKQNGAITPEQARRAKFDILPIHPYTHQSSPCFIMVEPWIRDEITGECALTVLSPLPSL